MVLEVTGDQTSASAMLINDEKQQTLFGRAQWRVPA